MKKSEKAYKNVSDWIEEKKHYHYGREELNQMKLSKGKTKEIGKIYLTRLLDKDYRLTIEWDRTDCLSSHIINLLEEYHNKKLSYTEDSIILQKIIQMNKEGIMSDKTVESVNIQTLLTNNMFTELKVINWQLEELPASKQKEVILKTTNNMLDEILYLQKGF